MIPGGIDHVLGGVRSCWSLDLILRSLRSIWPSGVLLEDDRETALSRVPFPFLRDASELLIWKAPGSATFLHVIKRADDLTIVADGEHNRLAQELLRAVAVNFGRPGGFL